MKHLVERALKKAQQEGASYADVRIIGSENESISVRNGSLDVLQSDSGKGFGVRVIADGAWGFSSSSVLTEDEIDKIASEAVAIAKTSAKVAHEPVKLANINVHQDQVPHGISDDPRNVPLSDRIKYLIECDKSMEMQGIAAHFANTSVMYEDKWFGSTEGAMIRQERIETGAGLTCFATDGKNLCKRSYPQAFGGDFARAGWSFVEKMNLQENGKRIARQCVNMLNAKPCPKGRKDIVIDGSQMALQVHESLGHPTELDRVFGTEAGYAGRSFMKPHLLGNLQYGSKIVNITADSTIPHALGGFAYDDEGIKAQRVHLIKDGLFVGYLDSREDAAKLGTNPMGAMRASSWSRIPIVRMVSVNLEPGDMTFDQLIGGVNDGIYLETTLSWSIDDHRVNFQFSTEIGWEIVNGKLGEMIRTPSYSGITTEFWNSCDGIGNKDLWHVWGVPNCGKGEPTQIMHVSHGTAPTRFRNVVVGVGS